MFIQPLTHHHSTYSIFIHISYIHSSHHSNNNSNHPTTGGSSKKKDLAWWDLYHRISVVEPQSAVRAYWDALVLLCMVYYVIALPLRTMVRSWCHCHPHLGVVELDDQLQVSLSLSLSLIC